MGDTVACKSCWGSHNRNFYLLVTPGLLSRHVLIGRASLSSRSLQAAWPSKMDADAAVSWSSLVKLSKKLGIVFLLEYNLFPELCLAYIDFYLYRIIANVSHGCHMKRQGQLPSCHICSDIKNSGAAHVPRECEKIYYSYNEIF